jgi:Na+-transporting NADH:ubiquinone oxidoreductase subunit A
MDVRHLKKGYDLRLAGRPGPELEDLPRPARLAAVAERLRFVRPRLAVKVGDRVKVGSLLFTDKRRPELQFRSPGGGTVCALHYGQRRRLQAVVIELDAEEAHERFDPLAGAGLKSIDRGRLIERIIAGGLWPLIRELPFRAAARPESVPPILYVGLDNLEPFHPRPEVYLRERRDRMEFGLRVLARIAGAPPVVTACFPGAADAGALDGLVSQWVRGNYPAHDPGVLLYRTKTSPEQNHAWFIAGQDVLLIAELLQTGRYPTERVVSVGGPAAAAARHVRTRIGAPLVDLTRGRTAGSEIRRVTGGVLTGAAAAPESFLGLFEKSLVLLPEGRQAGSFLGWMLPGAAAPSYSRAFASAFRRPAEHAMDCNRHGGLRACIQCNLCPQVCPVDILPQLTYKAILAGEVEEALAHGLLDCVECGLCSLVCPSKIELLQTLSDARARYHEEMG